MTRREVITKAISKQLSWEQAAKSWELRETVSLARLLAKLGRCDEARATLADNLRLVHRRIRHRRPEGCAGVARRAV